MGRNFVCPPWAPELASCQEKGQKLTQKLTRFDVWSRIVEIQHNWREITCVTWHRDSGQAINTRNWTFSSCHLWVDRWLCFEKNSDSAELLTGKVSQRPRSHCKAGTRAYQKIHGKFSKIHGTISIWASKVGVEKSAEGGQGHSHVDDNLNKNSLHVIHEYNWIYMMHPSSTTSNCDKAMPQQIPWGSSKGNSREGKACKDSS